jgi:hydrogenase maturation protein HypF
LDFRPLLAALIDDRLRGRDPREIARSFQRGITHGVYEAIGILCETTGTETVVLSGGVFQNELLLEDMKSLTGQGPIQLWTNRLVPSNDGGISLGQAALASFRNFGSGNA